MRVVTGSRRLGGGRCGEARLEIRDDGFAGESRAAREYFAQSLFVETLSGYQRGRELPCWCTSVLFGHYTPFYREICVMVHFTEFVGK